jgi:Uri superfamily endonuclease
VSIEEVWYTHSSQRLEHYWAEALSQLDNIEPVTGFGCSDCRCASHLFFARRKPGSGLLAEFEQYGIEIGRCR